MLAEYKELAAALLRFKSISTDEIYKEEIAKTAEHLKQLFQARGFTAKVIQWESNPIVAASFVADPALPTCLIYGHYDVQPAEQEEGWDSDPFSLVEHDGRFYGRGIVDNKGQFLIHVAAVFALIKEKKLAYNIKFLIEGNEESGSNGLASLLKKEKEFFKSDFAMVSDGEMTAECPSIEVGFRSVFNATLTLTTSAHDLHSGLFGGVMPNAAQEMAALLGKIYLPDHSVAIPGFYDGAPEVTEAQREENRRIPFDEKELEELTGAKGWLAEPGYDYYTQVGLRPTVQLTGLKSGYLGTGYRNSIPGTATAKFNFRLCPEQDIQEILARFRQFLVLNMPDYADCDLAVDEQSRGICLPAENQYVQTALAVLESVHNKKPLLKYCGGSLPIVTDFAETMQIPQVLVPLANEDCRMHAANENFRVDYVEKGLEFSRRFFSI